MRKRAQLFLAMNLPRASPDAPQLEPVPAGKPAIPRIRLDPKLGIQSAIMCRQQAYVIHLETAHLSRRGEQSLPGCLNRLTRDVRRTTEIVECRSVEIHVAANVSRQESIGPAHKQVPYRRPICR